MRLAAVAAKALKLESAAKYRKRENFKAYVVAATMAKIRSRWQKLMAAMKPSKGVAHASKRNGGVWRKIR
jgi:hypothetical protein